MDSSHPPSTSSESSDIFSLTDQVLSEKLQFIEEIGFGNWGSVWLCRPKSSSGELSSQKIAVKLVHRSKTSTTAARVRSLWNEMKIVRTFKNEPHPSIIPFHSFIITPSYALITMDYLPTLVPVEVEEKKARGWFRSLLSGVEFLHRRGVVHNDIKPANILLSPKTVPVLVDFGFAEKYDLESPTAFQSNLSYGTPEYLSPERARGLPHDTRKSDVWSLGVTFFEILIGRTPFEHSDGEQFTTKEDLEKYWARTLKGKWVGSWKLSPGIEKLLHRMIAPNADLRCTAAQAMSDPYWQNKIEPSPPHRRSSSYTSSVVFDKDMAKILSLASPWKSKEAKEVPRSPPGLDLKKAPIRVNSPQLPVPRAKSQTKVAAAKAPVRKRVPGPVLAELTPIKGSPPTTPSMLGKENMSTRRAVATPTGGAAVRKPFGIVSPRQNQNLPVKPVLPTEDAKEKRRSRILGDASNSRNAEKAKTNVRTNVNGTKRPTGKAQDTSKDSVRARVIEWEREKQRLREIARLEELERERDEEFAEEAQMLEEEMKTSSPTKAREVQPVDEEEIDESDEVENDMSSLRLPPVSAEPPVLPMLATVTPWSPDLHLITGSPSPSRPSSSGLGAFRHSIKKSIDTTFRLYKTSAFGQIASRVTSPRGPSFDFLDECPPEQNAKRDALRTSVDPSSTREELNEDGRVDRLSAWMRGVEKVVEDTVQGFESSSNLLILPPALPIAPVTRSASQKRTNRSSRLPRKVLAANEIFANDSANSISVDRSNQTFDVTAANSSAYATAGNVTTIANHSMVSEGRSGSTPAGLGIQTPSRQRRATVSSRSPEPKRVDALDLEAISPSKRKEKSKSHGNLFQQHIAPLDLLEAELAKAEAPTPSPRLSAVIDPSVFIARPITPSAILDESISTSPNTSKEHSCDSLNSSPLHVEPYPQRPASGLRSPLDTPTQRKIEGVYDRFLMATSGVKRLGKGYQSDYAGPVGHTVLKKPAHHSALPRPFQTNRRPMPPPVSSEDCQRRGLSVDELGILTYSNSNSSREGAKTPSGKEDGTGTTITLMKRAMKAFVPAKTTSKRVSRAVAA